MKSGQAYHTCLVADTADLSPPSTRHHCGGIGGPHYARYDVQYVAAIDAVRLLSHPIKSCKHSCLSPGNEAVFCDACRNGNVSKCLGWKIQNIKHTSKPHEQWSVAARETTFFALPPEEVPFAVAGDGVGAGAGLRAAAPKALSRRKRGAAADASAGAGAAQGAAAAAAAAHGWTPPAAPEPSGKKGATNWKMSSDNNAKSLAAVAGKADWILRATVAGGGGGELAGGNYSIKGGKGKAKGARTTARALPPIVAFKGKLSQVGRAAATKLKEGFREADFKQVAGTGDTGSTYNVDGPHLWCDGRSH